MPLSPAEKQRRYRARQAAAVEDIITRAAEAASVASFLESNDIRTMKPAKIVEAIHERGLKVTEEVRAGLATVLGRVAAHKLRGGAATPACVSQDRR